MSQLSANPSQQHPSMNRVHSFIIWNIRGGNNDEFKHHFRDLINTHNPYTVSLLETRMSNHIRIRDDFQFSNIVEIPAQGQSGGIAIVWHDNNVQLSHIRLDGQEIHAMIQVLPNHQPWLFSIVYASTNVNIRHPLLQNLANIANNCKGMWFLGGDFNKVISQQDKWGRRPINRNRASRFQSCINHYNLIDLSFKGAKYTWSNHRHTRSDLILERLDRCYINEHC